MAFGNATEAALILLLFNNTNAANIGDATGLRGSTTAGSLYLALHTASPGGGGTQATSEAAYTGYSTSGRQAVARSSGGWTCATNVATLAATASFSASTGTPTETETFASVGCAASGAGQIISFAALSANIVVNAAGVTPQLTTATTFTLT